MTNRRADVMQIIAKCKQILEEIEKNYSNDDSYSFTVQYINHLTECFSTLPDQVLTHYQLGNINNYLQHIINNISSAGSVNSHLSNIVAWTFNMSPMHGKAKSAAQIRSTMSSVINVEKNIVSEIQSYHKEINDSRSIIDDKIETLSTTIEDLESNHVKAEERLEDIEETASDLVDKTEERFNSFVTEASTRLDDSVKAQQKSIDDLNTALTDKVSTHTSKVDKQIEEYEEGFKQKYTELEEFTEEGLDAIKAESAEKIAEITKCLDVAKELNKEHAHLKLAENYQKEYNSHHKSALWQRILALFIMGITLIFVWNLGSELSDATEKVDTSLFLFRLGVITVFMVPVFYLTNWAKGHEEQAIVCQRRISEMVSLQSFTNNLNKEDQQSVVKSLVPAYFGQHPKFSKGDNATGRLMDIFDKKLNGNNNDNVTSIHGNEESDKDKNTGT